MRRFLLALMLGLASSPLWAGPQFGVGVADEIDGKASSLGTAAWLTSQRHPWEFMLGHISKRRIAAADDVPDATFVAVSKRISGRHWFLSSGIAHVDEDNEVLSGHFQFLTGVGYAHERWTVSLRHLSNASTNGRNRGETFVLLELGL